MVYLHYFASAAIYMVCGSSKVSGGSDQSHIYSGKLKKQALDA